MAIPSSFVIGAGPLARSCVDHLLSRGHSVVGVLTHDPALAAWVRERDLACLTWAEAAQLDRPPAHDFLLNIVNCRPIPTRISRATTRMRINYHDSLLPNHAGYFSTTWAILAGTGVHGVTWHLLEGAIDTGAVLVQREIPVNTDDTAFTLNTRCFEAAVESFAELVEQIEAGAARGAAQDLTGRTFASMQVRPFAGGIVDWHWPVETISRLVRSLSFGPTPNPMATAKTQLDDVVARIETVEPLSSRTDAPAGTILAIDGSLIRVTTGDLDMAVRLSAVTDPAVPFSPTDVLSIARVGRRLCSPDPAMAARIRQRYEAAMPAERRAVEHLTTCSPDDQPRQRSRRRRLASVTAFAWSSTIMPNRRSRGMAGTPEQRSLPRGVPWSAPPPAARRPKPGGPTTGCA
jgi:methionyl-tRNA formyltransferase